MRTLKFDYELGTVIMIIVFILTIFLLPNVALAQSGDLWFGWPGSIETKQPTDSTLCIASVEMPSHPQHIHSCRYEWTAVTDSGMVSGVFGYVGCYDEMPQCFDWPKSQSKIQVRKYVHWQTAHGGRFAWTARKRLVKQ